MDLPPGSELREALALKKKKFEELLEKKHACIIYFVRVSHARIHLRNFKFCRSTLGLWHFEFIRIPSRRVRALHPNYPICFSTSDPTKDKEHR